VIEEAVVPAEALASSSFKASLTFSSAAWVYLIDILGSRCPITFMVTRWDCRFLASLVPFAANGSTAQWGNVNVGTNTHLD